MIKKQSIFLLKLLILVVFIVALSVSCDTGMGADSKTGEAARGVHLYSSSPYKHVVIIGMDGYGGYYYHYKKSPFLEEIRKKSIWTIKGRNVIPTESGPNWAAMLSSGSPSLTGVKSNSDASKGVHFSPTMFYALKKQYPNKRAVMFHDWATVGQLVETTINVDIKHSPEQGDNMDAWKKQSKLTTDRMIEEIKRPDMAALTFVHLDIVDHAGHEYGWGTTNYYEAVESLDKSISRIITALDDNDKLLDTLVIFLADHGGIGKDHGGKGDKQTNIPLFL